MGVIRIASGAGATSAPERRPVVAETPASPRDAHPDRAKK
jgi:hypothetical protein